MGISESVVNPVVNREALDTNTLYENDFYTWIQTQLSHLRARDFTRLDINNLIEELEDMGRSERRQLVSRLEVLLVHLLKWSYQPSLQSRSWELTITEQRRRIARLLRDNPGLQHYLPDMFIDAYEDAIFGATKETGLPEGTFPEVAPYALDQVLDMEWLPE